MAQKVISKHCSEYLKLVHEHVSLAAGATTAAACVPCRAGLYSEITGRNQALQC